MSADEAAATADATFTTTAMIIRRPPVESDGMFVSPREGPAVR